MKSCKSCILSKSVVRVTLQKVRGFRCGTRADVNSLHNVIPIINEVHFERNLNPYLPTWRVLNFFYDFSLSHFFAFEQGSGSIFQLEQI